MGMIGQAVRARIGVYERRRRGFLWRAQVKTAAPSENPEHREQRLFVGLALDALADHDSSDDERPRHVGRPRHHQHRHQVDEEHAAGAGAEEREGREADEARVGVPPPCKASTDAR